MSSSHHRDSGDRDRGSRHRDDKHRSKHRDEQNRRERDEKHYRERDVKDRDEKDRRERDVKDRDGKDRSRHRRDLSRSPNRRDRDEKSTKSFSNRDERDDRNRGKKEQPVVDESRVKVEEGAFDGTTPVDKEAPNFEVSGKLLEDTNTFNGVIVKYSEPPEARKPKRRWRFYVFKGDESLPTLHIHRQSAFLLGKDRKVCDLPIDHPSCSRQHAVLQYRLVNRDLSDGTKISRIIPYIIDLGSSNGTFLNNQRIEPRRYVELKEKDVLKFGYSSREYVLLHDQSEGAVDSD